MSTLYFPLTPISSPVVKKESLHWANYAIGGAFRWLLETALVIAGCALFLAACLGPFVLVVCGAIEIAHLLR